MHPRPDRHGVGSFLHFRASPARVHSRLSGSHSRSDRATRRSDERGHAIRGLTAHPARWVRSFTFDPPSAGHAIPRAPQLPGIRGSAAPRTRRGFVPSDPARLPLPALAKPQGTPLRRRRTRRPAPWRSGPPSVGSFSRVEPPVQRALAGRRSCQDGACSATRYTAPLRKTVYYTDQEG
jgi:hypothetical protein